MEKAIKIRHESNIPTAEGYIGNNKMVLSMEDSLTNSKECLLTEEVHSNRISNMITYHVINNADANITKQELDYLQGNIFPINISNYKCIQKKKNTVSKQRNITTRNCHRVIAPKLGEVNRIKAESNVCLESKKRKDDKRRSTHNEIERRRRNKINSCIYKLKELIPKIEIPNPSPELNYDTVSTDSKSQILIRAYDYIQQLQAELKSFREYIKENEELRLSNQELHHKILQLQSRAS